MSLSERVRAWLGPRRVALLLTVSVGITIFLLADEVFQYHTINHDEGVYLQQAKMLLSGQFRLDPPVADAFRPWFFVSDGSTLYPKYAPVPAAMFAVGELLGGYRIALGLIGAAVIVLTYAVIAEVFDRTTGVVAAGLLAASPLFLVQASVFLPYVPTFAWTLLFAWGYLRADRTGALRYAALAGLAIGVAFFARPYTAVLFAAPFMAHALWTMRTLDRGPLARHGITAALGLVGVAVALGYNAAVTGSPLVFPYQAFAPLDGPGFGQREILGYERTYTLGLALEAHARALWQYVTSWTVAGLLGSVLAALGVGAFAVRSYRDWGTALPRVVENRERAVVLAGLFVTVPLGQLYFWGTLNILGSLGTAGDGLISVLGPYYHVSLLLPTAGFGAYALVIGGRRLADRLAGTGNTSLTRASLALVVIAAALGGGLAVSAAADPLGDNYETTQRYEVAYEPLEGAGLDNAVVFLPTPYGDWLNHPFQHLRNDPGYDGAVVYALQTEQFAVIDAFPDRQLYRYTYRGEWFPQAGDSVTPRLQRVQTVENRTVTVAIEAGVPEFAESVSLRAETTRPGYAALDSAEGTVNATVRLVDGKAVIDGGGSDDTLRLPVERRETITLQLFVDYGTVDSYSYVVEVPVSYENETYRVLTPRTAVCRNPRLCDDEAAYVPGSHRPGVTLDVSLTPNGTDTDD
jgi:hypothetical protein